MHVQLTAIVAFPVPVVYRNPYAARHQLAFTIISVATGPTSHRMFVPLQTGQKPTTSPIAVTARLPFRAIRSGKHEKHEINWMEHRDKLSMLHQLKMINQNRGTDPPQCGAKAWSRCAHCEYIRTVAPRLPAKGALDGISYHRSPLQRRRYVARVLIALRRIPAIAL